jgi:hypothetical protein
MDSTTIFLKIDIPKDIWEAYEQEAKDKGVDVNQVVSRRLQACQSYSADAPLYFNDKEKAELGTLIGKQGVSTVKQVLDVLRRTQTIRVGPANVELPMSLIKRINTRKFGLGLRAAIERDTLKGLREVLGGG